MSDDYTVDQLLERVDIVKVIGSYVKIQPRGTEFISLCPFHKEKTPSFTVDPSEQLYYCHGCGAGGSAYGFLQDHLGLSGKETYNKLKEHAGITDMTESLPAPIQRESVKAEDVWQPVFPVPEHAPKLMNEGRTNPIYNPKTDKTVTYKPEMGGVYPYRDQYGKLIGAVLRIIINDQKITPTVTYCVSTETGEEQWCIKGFDEPKPLYNIDRWAKRDTVLVVEGEKCTDAAHSKLSGSYDVCSWPNGTKAIKKVDWSPLYGRNVVLWADNDIKPFERGPREGQIKPKDEQNGRAAMIWLQRHLTDNGCKVVLLDQPENKPDGWDCADASEEDYDLAEYILDHMPEPEPTDTTEDKEQEQDDGMLVKPLGYDGSSFFYYSTLTQQLRELKDREHTENRLLALADIEYWQMKFDNGKGKADISAAASWMMSSCRLKGIFDPKTIRGRGCWLDDGRFVIHLGDRLIVDGQQQNINQFKSKYLYQAARRKKAPHNALTDTEAKGLLDAAKAFDWEMPASGALLAGFCVLAPICGSLEWRPHLWLTGGSGSGKSSVMKNYIKPMIGDMAIYTSLNSTEAGLRQDLGPDALPSIFEEFDPKTKAALEKAQGFFDLMRIASEDNGIRVLRGSTGGIANSFNVNTIFCLIGIQICTTEQAILNRTAKLALRPKSNKTDEEKQANAEAWSAIQAVIDSKVMSIDDLASRLLARTISMIGTIQHNIKVFRSAATKHFGNARYADQYGTLLAGAYSLASDCKIKEETALRYIASFDWTSYTEDSDVDESDQALSSIMQINLRVEGEGVIKTRSVGEWVVYVRDRQDEGTGNFGYTDVDQALKRSGLKCTADGVVIANKSDFLTSAMRDKPWGQNWNRYLKRAVTARGYDVTTTNAISFAPGLVARGVVIPYGILDDVGG